MCKMFVNFPKENFTLGHGSNNLKKIFFFLFMNTPMINGGPYSLSFFVQDQQFIKT